MRFEHVAAAYRQKKEKAEHYSRQLTYSLAIVCFIFFGTILSYHATEINMNRITGMGVAITDSGINSAASNTWSDITGFVWAVRTSPQVTEIKLFFYTLWILVVLVGSAVYHEFQEIM